MRYCGLVLLSSIYSDVDCAKGLRFLKLKFLTVGVKYDTHLHQCVLPHGAQLETIAHLTALKISHQGKKRNRRISVEVHMIAMISDIITLKRTLQVSSGKRNSYL